MTHVRLWRFTVPPDKVEAFRAAYGSNGQWARLFAEAEGFIRIELWRDMDGSFVTADHWRSEADFESFQRAFGDRYRSLDTALEVLASEETFIAALDSV